MTPEPSRERMGVSAPRGFMGASGDGRLRWIRPAVVFLVVAFFFSPFLPPLADEGQDLMYRLNRGYIEEHRNLATVSFFALSALKAGLAVLENSGINVGVDLKIGQVVQPVHDTVDLAWKVVMAAMIYYAAMGLFLQGLSPVFVLLLRAGLVCLGLSFLARFLRRYGGAAGAAFFRSLGKHLLLTGLTLYLFFPLFLLAGNFLSASITGEIKVQVAGFLESQKDVLSEMVGLRPAQEDGAAAPPSERKGWLSALMGRLKGEGTAPTDLASMREWAERKLDLIVTQTVLFIAAFLFDVFLVPVLSIVGLVFLLRALMASFRKEAALGKEGSNTSPLPMEGG